MKKLLLLLLLPFALTTHAQTDKELNGVWVFKDVYTAQGEDSKNAEKGKALLETLTINFLPNNRYNSQILGMAENGSFKIIDKAIHFTTTNGSSFSWPIIKFDDNELVVQRKTLSIILIRKK